MSNSSKYDLRGVSASKSDVHHAIRHLDKGLYPKAFCKVLPDIVGGDDLYCNLMHADTAGTKTSLAYLYWKETGDLSVWRGITQDAIVMNLDDMACVGCMDGIVISSTIGRNKHLIGRDVIEAIITAAADFFEMLAEHGIHVHMAGGETADVGDIVRTIDVGYTTFARMQRSALLVNDIRPGQLIVGLASYGQASYEDRYNSGIGSNGLTMARHDLLSKEYTGRYPASYDPNTDKKWVYTGDRLLTDPVPDELAGIADVGTMLLSPTRTYLPVLKNLFDTLRHGIHGAIHCTGGGQTKVGKFIGNVNVIKDDLLRCPPVFREIQRASGTSWKEMFEVFNMGHRMELFVSPELAKEIIQIAGSFGIDARIIGRVEDADRPTVTIKSEFGEYQYF